MPAAPIKKIAFTTAIALLAVCLVVNGYPSKKPTDTLSRLRDTIAHQNRIPLQDTLLTSLLEQPVFPKAFYGVAITLYEPGQKRMRSLAVAGNEREDLQSALNGLIRDNRTRKFHVRDSKRCHIQIDFILETPTPVNPRMLSENGKAGMRFEVGVDGLLATYEDKRLYFLPGDAFVKSFNTLNQIYDFMLRQLPNVSPFMLRWSMFSTHSFVSYQDRWIALYRGYPVADSIDRKAVKAAALAGVRRIITDHKWDGRFLYYYDAASDSYVDHEHPKRDPKKNPYYNELRHAGAIYLLLTYYESERDASALSHARSAIEWLIKNSQSYLLPSGLTARHVFYNKKSKLGGSGLTLFVLSEYERLTGDLRYKTTAQEISRHLLSQVTETGEFIYYGIYLDEPIVSAAQNEQYFNFYYPGEAILGLTSYLKYVATDSAEKDLIQDKLTQAMDFLVGERLTKYATSFPALPADSWLMAGVNELWDIPALRKDAYRDFVFQDADKMVAHMYRADDALYPDYVGAFYYNYGDPAYPDAARCEGLLAAYVLAKKTGDLKRAESYAKALSLAVNATYRLCNIPESLYGFPRPDRALGGIRFKPTRQWFRIDTIQHVVCYFLKYLSLKIGE